MSSDAQARNEETLDNLLARTSPLTREYAQMVRAEPIPELDARVLAAARAAAGSAGSATPASAAATTTPASASVAGNAAAGKDTAARETLAREASASELPARPAVTRKPAPVVDDSGDDDEDDDPRRSAKPRWLIPAFLAAAVLLAVGIGFRFFMGGGSDEGNGAKAGADNSAAAFIRRAKERREAARAAALSAEGQADQGADQDAAVVELNADKAAERPVLPPPPIFAPEAPQVEDLDAAIALIRKDLVVANQMSAIRAEKAAAAPAASAGTAPASPDATATAGGGVVIQPRERRLAKILELYDGGHHDLASDSLEIFLRDFADDPVSKAILIPKK
ncbi:MAG: hypothetical protein DYH20_12670 [Gammaproteobacteria bacterium PRO9]|nr:hypothetical protein [Gammaproteobacteria bacterium PRO9]